MTSTLFICRQGDDYGIEEYGYFRKFSGLFNSARLVNEMLQRSGFVSNIEIARDNNDIDRLVTQHKPTYCIIEAYWVVPEKFEILARLHPDITWVIRIHSELPFWATEGIAMDWTLRYLDYPNVVLAPNAERLYEDIKTVLGVKYDENEIDNRVVYLPNYYPSDYRDRVKSSNSSNTLNIGCFGAIRPMKNQLIQAVAAIKYSDIHNKKLVFHINGNRTEGGGDPVLKNIRNLFLNSTKHKLVEHPWQPHNSFLNIISEMDISMQVSFTESFNIVAADTVMVGVPVITSEEIPWVNSLFHAEPTSVNSIVHALCRAHILGKIGTYLNRFMLNRFTRKSKKYWIKFVKSGA